MVLKGVNWVHIDKIRSNGLERSQLCVWSNGLERSVCTKSDQMVLKRVNWAHNTKIRSYGLERSDMV